MHELSLADVPSRIGQELGKSEWITVDQTTIDLFADATHDHQFIHVHPERAAVETPFGGTIAHARSKVAKVARRFRMDAVGDCKR